VVSGTANGRKLVSNVFHGRGDFDEPAAVSAPGAVRISDGPQAAGQRRKAGEKLIYSSASWRDLPHTRSS
jgi:hypothetical protein